MPRAIIHPVAFHADHDDRIMRSGNGLPSEPARAAVSIYEPSATDAEAPKLARWESTDKRPKPEYNEEASATAANIAASPETQALVCKAPAINDAVITATMLGLPNGYSRSEEVLVETDSFKITRSSDGTIRNDLHCRPDLKVPITHSPSRPSIGATLTQAEIDQL